MVEKVVIINNEDIEIFLLMCRYLRGNPSRTFTPQEVERLFDFTDKVLGDK